MSEPIEGELVERSEAVVSQTMSPADLKRAVTDEKKRRGIIIEFVKSQLVDGTDYGKIHIAKNCDNKYNCTNTYHFSKDNLFKPGMEKVLSLMKLQSRLVRDEESIEMLTSTGWKTPTVAYKCELLRDGVVVAEGRGAAEVGAGGKDVNSTIKIAEKRARMDATLSLGFSEFFTQDLEDQKPPATVDGETGEIIAPPADDKPATAKQIQFARDMMIRKADVKTVRDAAAVLKVIGINKHKVEELTTDEAKGLLDFLLNTSSSEIREALLIAETTDESS